MPKQYLSRRPAVDRARTALRCSRIPRIDGVDGGAGAGRRALAGLDAAARQAGAALRRRRRARRLGAGGLAAPCRRRSTSDTLVLVHDAARPNLRGDDLDRLIAAAEAHADGAILAAPVRDTLKRADDGDRIAATEPREGLWRALTPQAFRRGALTAALEKRAIATASPSPTRRWRWSVPARAGAGRRPRGQPQGHHAGRPGAGRIPSDRCVTRGDGASTDLATP